MCSILICNKFIPENIKHSSLLMNRGPDEYHYFNREGVSYGHYLLNVTGVATPQPLVKGDIVALFNGEIYNYADAGTYATEVEMLLDCYATYGLQFHRYLDGEYAACIANYNKQELYLLTDPFATKPLYFSVENGDFAVSSFREILLQLGFQTIHRCPANSLIIINWKESHVRQISNVHEFDLRQHKKHYDDWHESFLESVKKRFVGQQYDVILPLSSGHDSGAIACALEYFNAPVNSYTYWGDEHRRVLSARLEKRQQGKISNVFEYSSNAADGKLLRRLVDSDKALAVELMAARCAEFSYGPDLDEANFVKSGVNDIGAQGLCYLLNQIKTNKPRTRILASGQGGDEIMGNLQFYGFPTPNPERFPDDLATVFPWQNFYLGAQSSYLARDEAITGGFGIEGRYPFLDKQVVQEFLSMTPDLKNREYKAPIAAFMQHFDYPFIEGNGHDVKRGFNV